MKIVDSKKWHKILKWDYMPNFQTCHRNDEDESFEAEYYEDDEITNLLENVFNLLKSEGSSNARLTGKMGSGKTTFLHYLKRIISKKPLQTKFVLQ
jgi:Cdc6-like AAA superfamily ATPase